MRIRTSVLANSARWESGKINLKVKKGSGKTQEGIQDIKANKYN